MQGIPLIITLSSPVILRRWSRSNILPGVSKENMMTYKYPVSRLRMSSRMPSRMSNQAKTAKVRLRSEGMDKETTRKQSIETTLLSRHRSDKPVGECTSSRVSRTISLRHYRHILTQILLNHGGSRPGDGASGLERTDSATRFLGWWTSWKWYMECSTIVTKSIS